MKIFIALFLILFIENRFRPRLEYIRDSKILLLFYSVEYSRKCTIIYKF